MNDIQTADGVTRPTIRERISRLPKIARWGVYGVIGFVGLKVAFLALAVVSMIVSLMIGVAFVAVLGGLAYALLKR